MLVRPHVQVEVGDASLPLLLLRRQALERWRRTRRAEGEDYRLLTLPPQEIRDTVLELCRTAHRLQTVTTWVDSVASLASGDAQNRAFKRETGADMTSYYDAGALTPEMIRLLADSTSMSYHVGYGPTQMKLFDQREVLVPGHDAGEAKHLLLLRGAPAVRAAMGYLGAVRRSSVPAGALTDPGEVSLTPRQHDVARLLADGLRDADAAASLGVSVRTFRTEVARLLDRLGCETRFAAGVRYSLFVDPPPTSPPATRPGSA
jgi:DNA-binding CsgD family transcriptional regulator